MRRREFITMLGCAAAAWPLAARAQQPAMLVRRIAILMGVGKSDPEGQARLKAFRRGLGEAGWVEGRNLHIEDRWGASDPQDFRAYAAELVRQRPEAILANTPPAVSACARRLLRSQLCSLGCRRQWTQGLSKAWPVQAAT
jgi:hypothetical protein